MADWRQWGEQIRGAGAWEDPERDKPKKWWEKIRPEPPSQAVLSQTYAQEQTRPGWQQALMGPSVAQTPQGFGQILAGTAPGVGLGGAGMLPWSGLGGVAAQQLGRIPAWMGQHKLLTGLGALGGTIGWANRPGQDTGLPYQWEPTPPMGPVSLGPEVPTGAFAPGGATPPDLPTPGEGDGDKQPEVINVGGQQFWWNPSGGIYGTGGWDIIPVRTPGLTPEQKMSETQKQRDWEEQMAQAERDRRAQDIGAQYSMEQRLLEAQGGIDLRRQAAAAQQQMSQMFAADPYKYWAQMGAGTPGAVAQLTGGEVSAGEPFPAGTPLSTPSAQWWGNLLPSEQQQIGGGLNWLGVDPQDWYSMYQRMIPGLGQRQMGPVWAR